MKYLKNPKLILILIIILGGFLRFYKLDWGEGLFAHPDEYHITISVNQLSFPNQMHPHFFSYGTVTIYLIYFTKITIESFSSILDSKFLILNSFLIGRFYSALFSTFTILIVYHIVKLVMEKRYALISTFLVAITPGLIQQAHFATPESILTFFIFLSLLFLLYFIKQGKIKFLLITSMSLGLGLGTKIISIFFLPVLFWGIVARFWRSPVKLISFLLIIFFVTGIIFALSSPFVFLDYQAWRSNFNYEGGLARGDIAVFYTRQFIDTFPIIFQLKKILPYTLGIPLLIFSITGILFTIYSLIRKFQLELFIVFITFISFFASNSLLFAKWTRFIAPTFPFFSIFAIFFISSIPNKFQAFKTILITILLISTGLWSLMSFSIYIKPDVRISADKWLKSNLSMESTYLVEGGNTVDLPLSSSRKISLNFYSLEDNLSTREKIVQALQESDYFIIQSRRVFKNHERLPNLYPKTARFYNVLFNGQLGFEKIKEFHSFPSIPFPGTIIEFPDEEAEETWSVFDHPVIRIYKKERVYSTDEYSKILNW